MAESTVVKIPKDGTITITDGTTPTAKSYTVAYEDGNFSSSQPKRERLVIRDRGTIVNVRETNEQTGTISFSVHMRNFTSENDATLVDVVEFTESWVDAVSTGGVGFEGEWVACAFSANAGTGAGEDQAHGLTFPKVIFDWEFSEGDPNVINFTGMTVGRPTRSGPVAS